MGSWGPCAENLPWPQGAASSPPHAPLSAAGPGPRMPLYHRGWVTGSPLEHLLHPQASLDHPIQTPLLPHSPP